MFDSDICKKKDGSPLKTYESEYEAQEAIEYVKRQYGNEQVSYKCSRCGYWHLSPKERQTPNHRSYCLDSNGRTKQAYFTNNLGKHIYLFYPFSYKFSISLNYKLSIKI